MELIRHYFPNITEKQEQQFAALDVLYREWNAKINVISRKDIDNLYTHHVLHSLAIARLVTFRQGTQILDLGTGGGFPGIPLAILFDNCHFTLLDSVGKKIKVASEVASALSLSNVECVQRRAEEEKGKYHFVVSRAVMPMPEIVRIVKKNISTEQFNAIPNGVICLKGGELQAELHSMRHLAEQTPISKFFSEEYFKTKKIVYVPV